jgi:uncharacterized membrane protein YdjX (TVP38/TMEM64 family)
VRFWTHFWASLLGYLLPLFLMSYFGQALFDAAKGAPTSLWIGLGAGIAVIALCTWALRRRSARAEKSKSIATEPSG